MAIKTHYGRFKTHLKNGGPYYAFVRGLKYLMYLSRRQKWRVPHFKQKAVSCHDFKIICNQREGISIFWKGRQVTKKPGLVCGFYAVGLWTDSSRAMFYVLESGHNFLKIRVVFSDVPVIQTWNIKIESHAAVSWKIDTEIQEWSYIDEFRVSAIVEPRYKMWVQGYEQGDFSPADSWWKDVRFPEEHSPLSGVRFSTGTDEVPAVVIETEDESLFPFVQVSPTDIKSFIFGFRKPNDEDKKEYEKGMYPFFSGVIHFFEKEDLLDRKIERFRQSRIRRSLLEQGRHLPKKRRMRALLVNLPWSERGSSGVRAGSRWPHIKDASEGNYLPFPFFLAYATSLLKDAGFQAELVDAIALGLSEEDFLREVSKKSFDILIVETSIPSFFYDMRLLKKLSTLNVPISVCGPNPEIFDRRFLDEYDFINFSMFGEYEWTLLELLRQMETGGSDYSGVSGLIWRDKKTGVVKNVPRKLIDINCLPWPYRDPAVVTKYWDLPGDIPHPSAQMVASRGCPFSCSFCLWPQVFYGGNSYRTRDAADCADEMEFLIRERGFKSIYFDDDTFNIGKPRILELCRHIKERGLEKTPWAVMAKADLMDEETLESLRDAGLCAIKYGVESASQELLDNCGKALSLQKTEKMILYTKSLGIKVHLTFSFGLPGETKDTIEKTIDYALGLDPYSIQFSILTPFPGTALYEELDKGGRILSKDWSLYDGHHSCVFRPDGLSAAELEAAKRNAYLRWGRDRRQKRGLFGDFARFCHYMKVHGAGGACRKTFDYLGYVLVKEKKAFCTDDK